jgi:hypothetical protein
MMKSGPCLRKARSAPFDFAQDRLFNFVPFGRSAQDDNVKRFMPENTKARHCWRAFSLYSSILTVQGVVTRQLSLEQVTNGISGLEDFFCGRA